jgi:hypothetical protein
VRTEAEDRGWRPPAAGDRRRRRAAMGRPLRKSRGPERGQAQRTRGERAETRRSAAL